MAQYNPLEIRPSACGKYYSYDDELYTTTFPKEWAMNHLPETGPKECGNCNLYGIWNGVFVCYCVDCARKYNGERGGGVYGFLNGERCGLEKENSAMNTYMEGVLLDDIGDKDFKDSAAVEGMCVYGETLRSITEYIIAAQNNPTVTCTGCLDDQPNQYAHMDIGGCLYEEYMC